MKTLENIRMFWGCGDGWVSEVSVLEVWKSESNLIEPLGKEKS